MVFSRYTLEAQIGRGGMGVVWRARDGKLDRPVALKFLPPEVAADAEAVRDLKLETRRCLELTHANIVRVYDFIEEDSGAAIAMEYVEGESLAKIKANAPGGCIAAADLTPFVAQLCAALRYAHQVAKIAHHDLKPANVLVTLDGVLKITDFGIARSLTETQTRLTGKIGNTSGTLYYMSPQQIAGEKPTASDDLYALGAMLYELLAGKTPFFRGDAFSVRQQVLERAPAPLEAHRREVGCTGAEIPAAWSETILACLAKKPEGRPASADEVAMRLGVALEPMATTRGGVTLTSLSGRTLGGGTGPLPPARRSLVPWLLAIGSAVIVLTGAGIYFGIYVPEQERLVAEAERAHRAELKLQAERAHRAEEQRLAAEAQAREERKKQEEARAQLAKDQEENTAMMARIAALSDTTPQMKINETNRAVRDYLRVAPAAYRDQVEKAWNDRQAAWRAIAAANRPGTVVVETDPAGATVVLYPRNLRKQSPALFEDVKPGDVSLHIEKDGFESKDVPYAVKPGVTNKLDLIKLTAIYGNATITSDPPDLYVVVEGNGKRVDGRTPFDTPWLPPGNYTVSYQRRGWRNPVVKNLIIERGKQTKVGRQIYTYEFYGVYRRSLLLPVEIAVATGSLDVPGKSFALAVFVHRDNPLGTLTLTQLDGIFGAQRDGGWEGLNWRKESARGPEKNLRTWGQLGLTSAWADQPIHLYGPPGIFPGGQSFFQRRVLGGGDTWAEGLREFEDRKQMMAALSRDPLGIAYTGLCYATPETKALALADHAGAPAVAPTRVTVANRSYPLARTVYIYFAPDTPAGDPANPKTDPKVREFLRYVLSRQGQADVAREGDYLPLSPAIANPQLEKLD